MNFEAYLISKKIDSAAFLLAEPALWKAWSDEFENMHPTSFTAQKLYLVNPIRRKYLLKSDPAKLTESTQTPTLSETTNPITLSENKPITPPNVSSKTSIPKPVFKPKPKMS